jgi:hypothetical protein
MTTSSVPPSYSTISIINNPITITGLSDTITLTSFDPSTSGITGYNPNTGYSGYSGGTVTINKGAIIGAGLNGTDYSTFTFNTPEDWVNQFPDWNRVQQMCKEYPGLEIAFEKFKTTYKLVKDHYDTPADQRPHP